MDHVHAVRSTMRETRSNLALPPHPTYKLTQVWGKFELSISGLYRQICRQG
ncbi:predicted protein [Plenodomus lingam JN3]|uniref:Predicted protein n=1 Tax=Leptosphaeria maculans (strain JN3 / isolate v23.1.3 / race Av1-4-5-6-7-8) TaxID=985895 RepID=E5A5G4_LEPMJ|nr:predicted protein [Plenodomus lingam JN3]CBX98862.1 predicted protein [Plenodomus lingam JN3]